MLAREGSLKTLPSCPLAQCPAARVLLTGAVHSPGVAFTAPHDEACVLVSPGSDQAWEGGASSCLSLRAKHQAPHVAHKYTVQL